MYVLYAHHIHPLLPSADLEPVNMTARTDDASGNAVVSYDQEAGVFWAGGGGGEEEGGVVEGCLSLFFLLASSETPASAFKFNGVQVPNLMPEKVDVWYAGNS